MKNQFIHKLENLLEDEGNRVIDHKFTKDGQSVIFAHFTPEGKAAKTAFITFDNTDTPQPEAPYLRSVSDAIMGRVKVLQKSRGANEVFIAAFYSDALDVYRIDFLCPEDCFVLAYDEHGGPVYLCPASDAAEEDEPTFVVAPF